MITISYIYIYIYTFYFLIMKWFQKEERLRKGQTQRKRPRELHTEWKYTIYSQPSLKYEIIQSEKLSLIFLDHIFKTLSDLIIILNLNLNLQILDFLGGSDSKESACQYRRHGFNPWVGKIPIFNWENKKTQYRFSYTGQ